MLKIHILLLKYFIKYIIAQNKLLPPYVNIELYWSEIKKIESNKKLINTIKNSNEIL